MKKNEALLYSAVGLAALFLILVAVNYLASMAAVRADLTDGNLYTLSDGTKKMLRGLQAPVKLKLYISQGEQAMPVQLRSFAQRVDDMARERSYSSRRSRCGETAAITCLRSSCVTAMPR